MSLDRSGSLVPVDNDGVNPATGDVVGSTWVTLLLDRIDSAGGFTTVLTPTTTGTQNAWAPGILGDTFIGWSGAGALTLNGIADVATSLAGQRIVIRNLAGQLITLNHNSGSAAAGEQIWTDGRPIVIAGHGAIELIRNGGAGAGHWVVANWNQGSTIPFTPTFTGLTVGNGITSGEYYRHGQKVWFRASFQFGSTSSMGATCFVDFPLTAANATDAGYALRGAMLDLGTAHYPLAGVPNATTSAQLATVGTTYAGIGTTAPFTWAAGDLLEVYGTYTAA